MSNRECRAWCVTSEAVLVEDPAFTDVLKGVLHPLLLQQLVALLTQVQGLAAPVKIGTGHITINNTVRRAHMVIKLAKSM